MATPSSVARPHATSTPTPKANPGSTPSTTHLTSPAAVAMARQFSASHRSPPTKMGHSHNQSASSHLSSTPLGTGTTPIGAAALADDSLGFNSPSAALIASLGVQGTGLTPGAGLTPLAIGITGDGLGISTGLGGNLSGNSLEAASTARDPDAERDKHLRDVVDMLKTRVAGRGVCRESVERLAQLAGFTFLWQDDTMTIAGNSVDLEIDFYPSSDRVRDVSLKIAIRIDAEAEERDEASRVLKRDLMQVDGPGAWKRIDGFAENLAYLGKLDQLSQGVNCFEAVEGLYESFQKIWSVEKKRLHNTGRDRRESHGAIGKPFMHRDRKLGFGVEFWNGRDTTATPPLHKDDDQDMDLDTVDAADVQKGDADIWTGWIGCEEGYPSIRVSKDWISVEALENIESTNVAEALSHAWLDPSPTLAAKNEDKMDIEDGSQARADIFVPRPPNARFVLRLEPVVFLPLAVASSAFNATNISLASDSSKMKGVQEHIRELLHYKGPSRILGTGPQHAPSSLRWTKRGDIFDKEGVRSEAAFAMDFHVSGQIWCYAVESIPFEHPRQIAGLLPIFRQYARLWSLIQRMASRRDEKSTTKMIIPEDPPSKDDIRGKRAPKKRSNINPRRSQLSALLDQSQEGDKGISVDMTLRFASGDQPQPILEVIFPLRQKPIQASVDTHAFGSFEILVELNGDLAIGRTENVPFAKSSQGREKMSEILRMSEDITALVAWTQRYLQSL